MSINIPRSQARRSGLNGDLRRISQETKPDGGQPLLVHLQKPYFLNTLKLAPRLLAPGGNLSLQTPQQSACPFELLATVLESTGETVIEKSGKEKSRLFFIDLAGVLRKSS